MDYNYRTFTWGHIASQKSIVSSPQWALRNWNQPDPPVNRVSPVIPKRLVSSSDLSVCETGGRDLGPYIAISHTWGTSPSDRDTTGGQAYRSIPGHEVKMKEIQRAVAQLGAKYFWIDTMCIDQNSATEKAEEIPKMGHYYRNASRTLVYLGDLIATDTLRHASANFEAFLEAAPTGTDPITHVMIGMSDDRTYMSVVFLLNALIDTLWGRRVWTIQEALLHPVMDFIVPGLMEPISSKLIENALYLKTLSSTLATISQTGAFGSLSQADLPPGFSFQYHAPVGEQTANEGRSNVPQVILLRQKTAFDVSTLLDALHGRECTIDADRVYGILGLLPYGSSIRVDYSTGLRGAMKQLFEAAIHHGDTSILYYTGKSYGMIPDVHNSLTSMVPRYTLPVRRAADSATEMMVEYVGEVAECIMLRDSISNAREQDKLSLTLKALYSVIGLMREGRITAEQAAYVLCLNMPQDRHKVGILDTAKGANSGEEQAVARGMYIAYGECKILLARIIRRGRAEKWVGLSCDEDAVGAKIVCMGTTSWEDRIGLVVRNTGERTVKRIGATGPVEKGEYDVVKISIPDE
ncbi:hypothetical protein HYDPIDRAFT_26505 [Hydnomerulius pinastri MD-312]|nr:hypothetical protein HYDPIDRAFT_26505 [Hydnomerulius pinastri MD-312]